MNDLILKLTYFLFLLPYLIVMEGMAKLNKYLKKNKRREITQLELLTVALILLAIILYANGFR